MLCDGATSGKIVKPIRVDDDGRVYVIPTDGTDNILFDDDDGNISGSQTAQVFINLNYVWNASASRWERMTQP